MIFYSLLAVVLLSPLPYGANRPWSWSLCAVLIALLTASWAIQVFRQPQNNSYTKALLNIADLLLAFLLVLTWAVLQSLSVFPHDWQHPLWQIQKDLIPHSLNTLSLNADDTITSAMRLLSYGLVFLLSFCYCQLPHRAKQVFYALMIGGCCYATYGLIVYLCDIKMVLWQQRFYSDSVSSTFINRNNFATYAGLTLLSSLAMLYDAVLMSAKYHIGGNLGLQRFLENLIVRAWFPLVSFVVIGTALILSHSRGGVVSSLFGLLILLAALTLNRHARNRYVLRLSLLILAISGFMFYMSSDLLLERIDNYGLSDPRRDEAYDLTWTAITTNPWLGFGLGSFQEVFTLYKSYAVAGTINEPALWDFAHNSYLESIFELGFPAALVLFYCFLRIALQCLIGLFKRRKDWLYTATGLAASALVAAHASVDFSLQIPAVVYTYALLVGAACAQSFSTGSKRLVVEEN